MAEQLPDFTQPPWVQSPSEVMDWINATSLKKNMIITSAVKLIVVRICRNFSMKDFKIVLFQ